MERREFLELIPASSIAILFPALNSCQSNAKNTDKKFSYHQLQIVENNPVDIPEGKRVPFNWPAIGINPGESITVKVYEKLPETNVWLRISIAQEIRDNKLLHVKIPNTDKNLGAIDIRFSSVLVPYELEISEDYIDLINKHGLVLTLESNSPLWIFSQQAEETDNSAFLPYILASSKKSGNINKFLKCFTTINSIQAFGWREGCVLDGLWQLYDKKKDEQALAALKEHFRKFLKEGQDLIYETGHSIPKDNEIDGIESTLPYATIARFYPDLPILKKVDEAWHEYKKENGMVTDGTTITAEGCYTVAYSMAVLGKAWNRKDLKLMALEQLKHREVLRESDQFYLRYYGEGKYTYQNWARGAAWFLVGYARTISELKDEVDCSRAIQVFQKSVENVLTFQRENGLWGCFMHEQNVLPDTSGSAGICAAIATGMKEGFLNGDYSAQIKNCYNNLFQYLTPDGFLKGVAQDNRGGVELQRSDYRVIAQMGMGLMAQLHAYL